MIESLRGGSGGRRPVLAAIGVEGLEGRQVLSGMGLGPGGMHGAPPTDLGGGPMHFDHRFAGPADRLPGGAKLNAAAKADLQRLEADAAAISAKSTVTKDQTAALEADLKLVRSYLKAPADRPTAAQVDSFRAAHKRRPAGATPPTEAGRAAMQARMIADLKAQGVPDALITKLQADEAVVRHGSEPSAADQATLDADRAAFAKDAGLPAAPAGFRGGF